MQLKRYEAQSIQEACKKIKADLGSDAVIFSTRTVKAGNESLSGKRGTWVEVTAAVERVADAPRRHAPPAPRPSKRSVLCDAGEVSSRSGRSQSIRSGSCADMQRRLQDAGFRDTTAWYLIGALRNAAGGLHDPSRTAALLAEQIMHYIPAASAIQLETGRKKTVALIGPTGVGKTTTLAKIAAQYCCARKVRVKLVSMDTYRIGAVDQLRTYASIMNIPFEVAADDHALAQLLAEKNDCDLLLIDTSGRNYLNELSTRDIRCWLESNPEIEVHMLLSATSSEDVLRATLERFDATAVDRLIITKVDETPRQGHLFDVLNAAGIPISYITTGQKVPEDIRPATRELMADMLVNGYAA